MEYGERELFL